MTIDADIPKFPTLEAGFMIVRVVMGKGCIMVAICPPNVGASNGNFFFFSQREQ